MMIETAEVSLPGFEIQHELGRGAMGVVLAARQPKLDRVVAVKVIPRPGEEDAAVQRFLREVRLCAALAHPHVVKMLDAGETDRWMWLAMELVQGRSLDRVLAGAGALPPAQLLQIMEQLADALDFVHSKNIVHRDVKPANVMLEAGAAKLMDFGLARGLSSHTLTAAEVRVGSPRYLAPETITEAAMSSSSDLYALGVTFHEMATGASTYHGLEFNDLMRRIVNEPLPPPSRLTPGFPASVERVIMQLLEKDPARRTPDAATLLAEIRALRADAEFLGTSWETSRAQLPMATSAPALGAGMAAPSHPHPRTGRTRVLQAPVSGKAPAGAAATSGSASAGSFVLPAERRPWGAMAGAGVAGAVLTIAVALVMAPGPTAVTSVAPASGPGPVASTLPAAPAAPAFSAAPAVSAGETGVDPRVAGIDSLAQAVSRSDLPKLVDALERDVFRVSGWPRANPTPAQAERIGRARGIARAQLEALPLARPFRELTGAGPFSPRPAGTTALLSDHTLPLSARRRYYDALVFLSHLDDLLVHRCGVGPAFAAQDELAPWARVLEPAGADEAQLAAACNAGPGRTVSLHRNAAESSLYLFAGLKPVAKQEVLVAGPVESSYTKSEDTPIPVVALTDHYETVDLHALTEDVDRMKFFELEFTPEVRDGTPPVSLILRPLHAAEDPNRPRVLGLSVHRDLLPPARYRLRIRAFRLIGEENGGCRLGELCARMR